MQSDEVAEHTALGHPVGFHGISSYSKHNRSVSSVAEEGHDVKETEVLMTKNSTLALVSSMGSGTQLDDLETACM